VCPLREFYHTLCAEVGASTKKNAFCIFCRKSIVTSALVEGPGDVYIFVPSALIYVNRSSIKKTTSRRGPSKSLFKAISLHHDTSSNPRRN